jgi:hypothetical protein
MRYSRAILLVGCIVGTLLAAGDRSATAAEYRFGVPSLDLNVVVNPDASVRMIYDIRFQNNAIGHPIDVVDIGTPNDDYDLARVEASIDGTPLHNIRESTYIDTGFEVHLGSKTIPPGGSGTLHVEFNVSHMVYQDTTRDDYASLRVTPTWFGSQYVTGNTHIKVAVHAPKGVAPEELLHQGQEFSEKALFNERAVAVWQWPADRLDKPHMVGLSFPKHPMDRVIRQTAWGLLLKWFANSTQARVVAGLIFVGLLGFAFFRFSGGTGVSVFFVLTVAAVFVFVNSPFWHLVSMPVIVVVVGLNEWMLSKRKAHYMPPIAETEGGGIKRGLTAPEAAALLELPIARVLGLVIFGMLKKGVVHQLQADPLVVDVDEEFKIKEGQILASPEERASFYRKAAQKRGIVVHKYEQPFLYLLTNNPGKPVKEIDFSVPMKQLLERVASRMKGFDLSDTQAYYRSIVRRATDMAKQVGDIPQREKLLDRNFEWILMDDDYPTVFTTGRPYWPIWTRGGWSGSRGPATAAPRAGASGPEMTGSPSFGDVASSFAGWTENTMGSLASSISPGALQVENPSGGFLDLSGADRVTGEFFEALSESGGSGGGVGGGCACAGCACACACAGGGR